MGVSLCHWQQPTVLGPRWKISCVSNELINIKVSPLSATASSNRKNFTLDGEIYGKTGGAYR